MAVAHVSTGAVQAATATSDIIPTPAGAIGDLVVFLLVHDDFSDGNLSPISPGVTLTEFIPNQSTQFGGDFRTNAYWGIEDQAAARNFSFGTLGASEEIRGVCVRFSGQHATVPILAGSPAREGGLAFVDLQATEAGQMFVQVMFWDANPIARTPKHGWTERVDSFAAGASIYCATKPVTTEELSVIDITPRHTGTTGPGYGFGFVIAQAGATARAIAGVTRDNAGDVEPSCEVSLFKETATGVYAFIATQTSHGTTGAYSFTVYDNPSSYMVVARKDGTPNTFDVTDNNLTPV